MENAKTKHYVGRYTLLKNKKCRTATKKRSIGEKLSRYRELHRYII